MVRRKGPVVGLASPGLLGDGLPARFQKFPEVQFPVLAVRQAEGGTGDLVEPEVAHGGDRPNEVFEEPVVWVAVAVEVVALVLEPVPCPVGGVVVPAPAGEPEHFLTPLVLKGNVVGAHRRSPS